MTRVVSAAAAFMMVLAPTLAHAQQQTPIKLSAKASFKHRHSKLQMPPVLVGLQRTRMVENEGDQLDVAAEYATADQGEVFTVYLYRQVAGDLAVWFDRAQWMIEHRDVYGKPTVRAGNLAFAAPGQSNAGALAATYDLAQGPYRSTGIALVPLGEWLVKVRASSKTLTGAQLDARIKTALAELDWPKRMPPAPAAAAVLPCATPLSFAGNARPATAEKSSGAALLMDALMGSAIMNGAAGKESASPPSARWCRDPAQVPMGAVYRDEQANGYLIAVGDAGRAVRVGPSAGQQLLAQTGGDAAAKPVWTVALVLLPRTLTSSGFDRLPPPAQAMEVVASGRFASSAPTWGKAKGKIEINGDALR